MRSVWIRLVVIYVLWGTTYLAMRVAVASLPPWGMAGARFVLAGGIAILIARLRGGTLPPARAWVRAVPGGFLLFFVGNGLIAVAEQSIASSVAAVVAASSPLFAAAFHAALGKRPTRGELAGMALGMTGVVLLAGSSAILDAGIRGLLLLVAPLGFALGSVLLGRSRDGSTTPLVAAGLQMLAGGAAMLLMSAAVGERVPRAVPWPAVGAWLYLVIAGSLVGFTVYTWLLRHAPPTTAMSHAYVNPLVALVLGAAVGGEHLAWTSGVAAALIAGGVVLAVNLRSGGRVLPERTEDARVRPVSSAEELAPVEPELLGDRGRDGGRSGHPGIAVHDDALDVRAMQENEIPDPPRVLV